ncbi:hypothetical protein ACHAXA_006671 [Cyclostephanos tholiformis]|uniref:Uncharacterized protein n=1 Tax=Cyclostephanos tholiformis TaxID=382380 RepID=A0ABD3R3Y2_9STRA
MARVVASTAGIVGIMMCRWSSIIVFFVVVSHHRPSRAAVVGFIVPGPGATIVRRRRSSTTNVATTAVGKEEEEEETRNGRDPEYPWEFEGRFVFRPSLVRVVDDDRDVDDDDDGRGRPPVSASLLSIFGYTLGGSVILEYETSPVGPYREYVTMGGIVGLGMVDAMAGEPSSLALGQWGTDLYVSTDIAVDVCRNAWGVPAQLATIVLEDDGDVLVDDGGHGGVGDEDDDDDVDGGGGGRGRGRGGRPRRKFVLSGWRNARTLIDDDGTTTTSRRRRRRYGNIPIFWTPTIKALWAPVLFPLLGWKRGGEGGDLLPLHKLRLSASAVGIRRCRRIPPTRDGEVPLGFALVVDNVLIEIGELIGSENH